MKRVTRVLIAVLILTSAWVVPSFAASKSARIQVSCSISPAIEMSSAAPVQVTREARSSFSFLTGVKPSVRQELALAGQASMAVVKSNMGNQYFMAESLRAGSAGAMKVITAAAL